MQEELEALKDALFEIYSAGFEAGYAQNKDLASAFEEWFQKAMLQHLPPNSPYIS